MIPGTKWVHEMLWPESDVDCAAVTFREVTNLQVALKYCNRGKNVVVQAGGNAGVWPRALATEFKTVYTFEPEPLTFQCLDYNCPSDSIICRNVALGAEEFFVGVEYPEGVRNMGACRINWDSKKIPQITIDSLELLHCDFIQLDIEGYEPYALQGAHRTLKAFRPILMLEMKGLSEHYGFSDQWIRDFLKVLKYKEMETIARDVIFVPEEYVNA